MSFLFLRRRVPPVDALRALAAADPSTRTDRFYFEHAESGRARVALGRVASVHADGPDRFTDASLRAAALLSQVTTCGDEAPAAASPILLGGFAFDDAPASDAWSDFANSDLVLPELLLVQERGASWLCASAPARLGGNEPVQAALDGRISAWRERIERTPVPSSMPAPASLEHRAASDRPPASFSRTIARAVDAIAAGEFEKVVLARSIAVTRPGGFDVTALLHDLRAKLPSGVCFLIGRGEGRFVGVTPERLLWRAGRQVRTAAVAGTAPRGRNPEEDLRFARELLESKKEQAEHAVVLRFLHERLGTMASEITSPEAPELLALESLQHLRTPVTARLDGDTSVLVLVGALHPTPATGGAPTAAATAFIDEHEGLDRGWYAGPIGWTDGMGDGEFWVALRSGLARGDTFRLFAGAGVVADSDPAAELRETRLKFSTLLPRLLEV